MSFGMIDTEVRQQMGEVRRQVTRGRMVRPAQPASEAGASPMDRPAEATAARWDRRRRPALRSRIGFTLVETGLRLLTSGQQAHG